MRKSARALNVVMGFDQVLKVDSGSRDRTVEQLRALVMADWPIRLRSDPQPGYIRVLTGNYRRIGEESCAAWLIFVDSDEFILFPEPARIQLDRLPRERTASGFAKTRCTRVHLAPGGREGGRVPHLDSRGAGLQRDDPGRLAVPEGVPGVRWEAPNRGAEPVRADRGGHLLPPLQVPQRGAGSPMEVTKVAGHREYDDRDLPAISALGVVASRARFKLCEREFDHEAWRSRFDDPLNYVEDRVVAEQAGDILAWLPAVKGSDQ